MNEKIKVLMVIHNLDVANGVASFAMNYYRHLNHEKVQIDFAIYSNHETPYKTEIEAVGGHVYVLPPVKHLGSHLKACRHLIESGKYDVIHDNTLLISIPLMREAKRQKVTVRILHSHNSRLGETKKKQARNALFLPYLRRQANAYAACSELAAKAMFGESEYTFIPNVIEVKAYQYDTTVRKKKRSEMKAEKKRIIQTVGRLAFQKNPFFAMEVFDLIADCLPDVEYWWIGNGPLEEQVAAKVKQLKHADRVKLLGSREDVPDLYQAGDLFFCPSVFEGLSIALLEAQASGLPCVVSNTLSREVECTDLVHFFSLDEPAQKWSDFICKTLLDETTRRERTKELLQSKFSSLNAGPFIEEYWNSLLHR